jgi:hypothetical protein
MTVCRAFHYHRGSWLELFGVSSIWAGETHINEYKCFCLLLSCVVAHYFFESPCVRDTWWQVLVVPVRVWKVTSGGGGVVKLRSPGLKYKTRTCSTSECRSEVPGKFLNVVLETDGED